MAGPVEQLRQRQDLAAQRQYRGDLRRHLEAAQTHLAAHEWTAAGRHLIAAGGLVDQGLIEKLREPVVRH